MISPMPPHPTTTSNDTPAVADELAAIAEVVQLYCDGIHHGDVAKLSARPVDVCRSGPSGELPRRSAGCVW